MILISRLKLILNQIPRHLQYYYAFLVLNSAKMVLAYLSCDVLPIDYFLYSIIVESICLSIVLYETTFIIRGRIIFIVLYLLQGIIILINLFYYALYNSLLPITLCYRLFWELLSLGDRTTDLPFKYPLIITLLDLPVFLIVCKNYLKIKSYIDIRSRIRLVASFLAMLLIVVSLNSTDLFVGKKLAYLEANVVHSDVSLLHRFGIFAYNLSDLSNTQQKACSVVQLDYGPEIKFTGSASARYDIMLIQVESLDANIIDYSWKGHYVVPFLHRLSRQNMYFPYMMVYHTAGGSSDCEIAALNSVEPMPKFPTVKLEEYEYPNSLVKRLSRYKYKSAVFHGNDGTFYNRDFTFFKMGFSLFYDRQRMNLPEEKWGASDEKVFDYVLTKLNPSKNNHLFSYIITLSSHEPYNIVESYYKDDEYKDMSNRLVRRYFQSMKYVDKTLEKFLMQVKARKPDTYVFIFGDHTSFVIKDGPFRPASFVFEQRNFEFVPLIIITPEGRVMQEKEKAVSLLDIAPTVLSGSGVSASIKSYGDNLMETFNKKIPYQGKFYDRRFLYSKAANTIKW